MNQEIKIEKGVPIPGPNSNPNSLPGLMKQMQIGDSFLSTFKQTGFSQASKKVGIKVISRKTGNPGEFRIWRTA